MIKYWSLIVMLACPLAAWSHGPDEHSHEGADHKAILVERDLLNEIKSQHLMLEKAVNSKQLSSIHDISESLAHSVGVLDSQVSGDNVVRIKGAINNLKKIANNLHQAGDKSDIAGAELSLKRLTVAIKVLEGQLLSKK